LVAAATGDDDVDDEYGKGRKVCMACHLFSTFLFLLEPFFSRRERKKHDYP
jgi:hypothetical protein